MDGRRLAKGVAPYSVWMLRDARRFTRSTLGCTLATVLLLLGACTDSSDDGASATTADTATDPNAGTTSPETTTVPDDEPTTTGGGDVEPLDWGDCQGFECATLQVPLLHDDPDGEQIELAVIRRPATDPDQRIGSVVINPGGPGGSGVDYLRLASLTLPPELGQRFDLVSFDPRGVGESTAFDCDLDLDDTVLIVADGDDEAWEATVDADREQLASCPTDALDLASYLGTNNAARDMDILRAALGDEALTYLGYSYGTRLGATYAELFPDRVRAMVLDAAVLPSSDLSELFQEQAAGFDNAFENFAAACDADPDCILADIGPTIGVFRSIETEVLAEGSLPTDDGDRALTPGEYYLGVFSALYSVDAWPILAQALYTAETSGDGTLLQALADVYLDRNPDGSYGNSNEANVAINCADDPSRPPLDEVKAEVDQAADQSQYFGPVFRADTNCAFLPIPIDPLQIGPAEGAPPILVIGNTEDPATPYAWSQQLADTLDSATLFTVEAEGHTAYGTFECVAEPVNRYLIDLEVPDEGASCSASEDADYFSPAGEGDLDVVIAFFDCLKDEGLDIDVTASDILADPTGEELLSEVDLEAPETLEAVFACQELLPTS